ncbi:MAG: hypothetical protein IJA35_03215 [Clostridia bacterium]|nr:hypothetical protein [Clostridia bacterium]
MREYKNQHCKLNDTELCRTLNMQGCDECPLNDMSEYDRKRAAQEIMDIRDMMPEGELKELFTGDECMLCVGDTKNKKEFYALVDLVRPKNGRKSVYKGISGITSSDGYLIPVQIASCKRCMRNFKIAMYAPIVLAILIGLIPIAALSVRTLREQLMSISHIVPFIVFLLFELIAIALYVLLSKYFAEKLSSETILNVMNIDKLRYMAENGWIELQKGKKSSDYLVSSPVFAKKRLKYGMFTAASRQKTEENIADKDSVDC